jgi:hypothetical protein
MRALFVLLTAGALVIGFGAGLVLARAQSPSGTFRFGHVDTVLPSPPCKLTDSDPVVYQGQLFIVYTCSDGTQHARRFVNPADSAPPPTVPGIQPAPPPCNNSDRNWAGTGMTECEWRRRNPTQAPGR